MAIWKNKTDVIRLILFFPLMALIVTFEFVDWTVQNCKCALGYHHKLKGYDKEYCRFCGKTWEPAW